MNILCIGDVVGEAGLDFLCGRLPGLKREYAADLTIVNGENADKSGVGTSRAAAEALLAAADVVTGGNHSLRRAPPDLFLEHENLLMPANFPFTPDEAGCCLVDTGRLGVVRVISLCGTAWMEPIDNPFVRADALLGVGDARFTVVDFHAESTAEKQALAWHLDGRAGAVFGTHTHVQTADEQILPGGTGYISDIGMTGPRRSVIGIDPALAVKKQRSHQPVQFKVADGPCQLCGALFVLDDATGLCREVRRVRVAE